MKIRSSPSLQLDQEFLFAAKEIEGGSYILDGELTYLDWQGWEHRTGAQAARVNDDAGKSSTQPEALYCIFEALYYGNYDLTTQTKQKRIAAGRKIFYLMQLINESQNFVECLHNAFTIEKKLALSSKQKGEDREGEAWTLVDTRYIRGKTKGKDLPTGRTKYLTNWELVVTGLTPPQIQGRPFGTIEVALVEDSGAYTLIGSVGTCFTLEEMKTIAEKFSADKNIPLMIKVISQGVTENGQLWHARYDGLTEEE
jgi:ATP-dependent DNA ligase